MRTHPKNPTVNQAYHLHVASVNVTDTHMAKFLLEEGTKKTRFDVMPLPLT